jgi:hypothetical protein
VELVGGPAIDPAVGFGLECAMRAAAAFLWFVAVVGGYVWWCNEWAGDRLALNPMPFFWLPLVLLFVVPVLISKKRAAVVAPEVTEPDKAPSRARPMPIWVWLFVFGSGWQLLFSIPSVVIGGLAKGFHTELVIFYGCATLLGIAGVLGCLLVGRLRFRSVVRQAALCGAIMLVSLIPALLLLIAGLGGAFAR